MQLHEDDRQVAIALSNTSSSIFTRAFVSYQFAVLPIVTHRRIPLHSLDTVMIQLGELTERENYGVAFSSPAAVKSVLEADTSGVIRLLLSQASCYAWGRSTQATLAASGIQSLALSSKSASQDLTNRILRTNEVAGVAFICGEVTTGNLSKAMASANLSLETIPVYRMEEIVIKKHLLDRLETSVKSLLVMSTRSLERVCGVFNRNVDRNWVVVPSDRLKTEVNLRIPNCEVVVARSASPNDCARALKIALNTHRYRN